MIHWPSSPQHCLLVKQALAQQVHELPTLHREWIFFWVYRHPEANQSHHHHTLCKMMISSIYIKAWELISSIELWKMICLPFSLPFTFSNLQIIQLFLNLPSMHHALPTISSEFCNLDIIWWILHFNMQCSALLTVIILWMYFKKSLLCLTCKLNYTCTLTCSRPVVR